MIRLAENVSSIAEFYQKREEYESAAERYRSLLNEYPGLGLDAQALYNLGVCYAEMRRDDEAQRIFHSIVQNYADSEYAEDAAARCSNPCDGMELISAMPADVQVPLLNVLVTSFLDGWLRDDAGARAFVERVLDGAVDEVALTVELEP